MTNDADMHRASDVLKDRPWYVGQPRRGMKDSTKAIITCLVMLGFFGAAFYRMVQSRPERDEHPPKTVQELLEAIRPQIVEPEAEK